MQFTKHQSSAAIRPGINFKRDATTGIVTAGECDGSRAIPVLSSLTDPAGVEALRSALVNTLGSSILNMTVP